MEHLINAERWVGLKRVGLVEAERRILGQPPTIEQRYYLVSFEGDVQRFAEGVRSHWGLKTNSTGCSMSRFRKMPPEFVKTMPRRIWPSSATSPSISCARTPLQKGASRLNVCKRDGTMTTSLSYSPLEDAFALPVSLLP